MAQSTSGSANGGDRPSRRAKSTVGGAAGRSSRANRGTSATTTSTEASGEDQNTRQRTGRRQNTPLSVGTVVEAVERDLAAIADVDPDLAISGLAALALALAREMDNPNSATSKSMCAGQLRDTLDRLRELMPPEQETNEIDELRARRERRVAGHPGSSAPVGS